MTVAILLALGAYACVAVLVCVALQDDRGPSDTPLFDFVLVVVLSALWPIGFVYQVCHEVRILWKRGLK